MAHKLTVKGVVNLIEEDERLTSEELSVRVRQTFGSDILQQAISNCCIIAKRQDLIDYNCIPEQGMKMRDIRLT